MPRPRPRRSLLGESRCCLSPTQPTAPRWAIFLVELPFRPGRYEEEPGPAFVGCDGKAERAGDAPGAPALPSQPTRPRKSRPAAKRAPRLWSRPGRASPARKSLARGEPGRCGQGEPGQEGTEASAAFPERTGSAAVGTAAGRGGILSAGRAQETAKAAWQAAAAAPRKRAGARSAGTGFANSGPAAAPA